MHVPGNIPGCALIRACALISMNIVFHCISNLIHVYEQNYEKEIVYGHFRDKLVHYYGNVCLYVSL